jgi:pimeloyl-ACP methyl ester carboxylesterase
MIPLPQPYDDTLVDCPDGRILTVARWGKQGGLPVVSHHGTPMSRLDLPVSLEVLDSLGIDLIMYDRPGYGGSTPQPGRRVADAAADVAAVADALDFERFAVHGVSGGGPHALACAALLPQRVTRAASVVGLAPLVSPEGDLGVGMSEATAEELQIASLGREALEPYIGAYLEAARTGADLMDEWIDELPEPDREVYRSAEVRRMLDRAFAAAFAVSGDGWIDDDLAFVGEWGFDLGDIRVPVGVWVGAIDVLVPPSHGRLIAGRIPTAELHEIPDRGHELNHTPIFEWLSATPILTDPGLQ